MPVPIFELNIRTKSKVHLIGEHYVVVSRVVAVSDIVYQKEYDSRPEFWFYRVYTDEAMQHSLHSGTFYSKEEAEKDLQILLSKIALAPC